MTVFKFLVVTGKKSIPSWLSPFYKKMKRKRANAKNKAKLSSVCNVDEVIQNVVRASRHECGSDADYEANEMAEKNNKRTNHRASGRNAKEIEKTTNSSRGVSPLSSGAEQVHNERSSGTVPILPHQDMQFKDHELTAALVVVKKVMKMDAAAPFNLPVDPIALGIPDYLDVIETPMDFSTVCNNIENGQKYRSSNDVFEDVQYIWDNCIKYNKKGHYILELLKKVKRTFMILWTEAGLFTDQQLEINGYPRLPTAEPDITRKTYGRKTSLGVPTESSKHSQQDRVDLSRHQSHHPSLSYAYLHHPQQRPSRSPSSSPEPWAYRTVDSLKAARRLNPCGHGCQLEQHQHLHQHQYSVNNCKSHKPHQTPCNCHSALNQSEHSHQLEGAFMANAENSHFPLLRESSARQIEVSQSQLHRHPPALYCTPQYQTQKRSCQDIPISGRQLYSQSVAEFNTINAGNCADHQHNQPSCSYGRRHIPIVDTCGGMLSSRKRPTTSARPNAEDEFRSRPVAESMIRYNKRGPTKYPPRHIVDDLQEQDTPAASPPRSHQPSLNCGYFERRGVDQRSSPGHASSEEPHADVDMDGSDDEFLSPHPTESMMSCAKRGPTVDPGDQQQEISPSQIHHKKKKSKGTPNPSQPPPSHSQAPSDKFTAVLREVKKKSRGRGPTQCLDVWNSEDKICVSTDEFGQPIGPEAPKFICFLGTIARNGRIAPLNYINWKAVPDENKEEMWQLVVSKFSLDPQSKDSILKSIGTKWKNWKALLKANHYNPHETDEERLADCNERVQPDQWRILVSFWNSAEAKERSNINKANRSKYTSNHACGSKSFARVREEQRIKRPEGKGPSQADLFIVTRTRKNGEAVNEASSVIISKLRDAAQKQGTLQKDTIADEVFVQVMGEETPGRVRIPGVGPTVANLRTPQPLPAEAVRIVSEANAEVREMREKMVIMEQTCAQMATQIATMMMMMQKKFPDKDPPNEDASKSSERFEHSLSSIHSDPSLQRSTRSGKK